MSPDARYVKRHPSLRDSRQVAIHDRAGGTIRLDSESIPEHSDPATRCMGGCGADSVAVLDPLASRYADERTGLHGRPMRRSGAICLQADRRSTA
jgi:hypothetical protein